MKIKIDEANKLSISILKSIGFTEEEARLSTENCIEGELTGKKSHGLIRIPTLKRMLDKGKISVKGKDISIIKETKVSLLVNGQNKTGLYVVNKALELGIKKAKESGIVVVGCTNTAPISGMIGMYARKATDEDLIYIGFNNSSGGNSVSIMFPFSFLVLITETSAIIMIEIEINTNNKLI